MDNSHEKWILLNKELSARIVFTFCNTREVWWCSIGMNIGTELYGKNELFERPVLIMKVYNKETIFILPITSKIKDGKYYLPIGVQDRTLCIVLSQGRTVSTKRLSRKICRISEMEFQKVKERFKRTFEE